VLQNLLSVYLCNKKDIEREEIEKFHVYSGKLSRSLMRHQISRDVLRLVVALFIGIVVTADKLKTRKEISSLVATFGVRFAMGRMMAGFPASGVYTRDGCQFRRGSSERDRQRHQGREIQWPGCRSRDEAYFDKVVVNRGYTDLKELSNDPKGKSTAIIGRVGCNHVGQCSCVWTTWTEVVSCTAISISRRIL
jgi:hypothetical protein